MLRFSHTHTHSHALLPPTGTHPARANYFPTVATEKPAASKARESDVSWGYPGGALSWLLGESGVEVRRQWLRYGQQRTSRDEQEESLPETRRRAV